MIQDKERGEYNKFAHLDRSVPVDKIRSTNELLAISDRQQGNTTRQINYAIDLLFNGNLVVVRDHFKNGTHRKANEYLFERIINRLHYEHNLDRLIEKKRITINRKDLTIKLG